MKTFILSAMSLVSLSSQAASLSGEWQMKTCTQTQINGRQGFVTESYTFEERGSFKFVRTWFEDSKCQGAEIAEDLELGSYHLGKENTNNGFNPAGTFEVDFTVDGEVDRGLLWTSPDRSQLRLSRGLKGGMRNTMLSFFIYRN